MDRPACLAAAEPPAAAATAARPALRTSRTPTGAACATAAPLAASASSAVRLAAATLAASASPSAFSRAASASCTAAFLAATLATSTSSSANFAAAFSATAAASDPSRELHTSARSTASASSASSSAWACPRRRAEPQCWPCRKCGGGPVTCWRLAASAFAHRRASSHCTCTSCSSHFPQHRRAQPTPSPHESVQSPAPASPPRPARRPWQHPRSWRSAAPADSSRSLLTLPVGRTAARRRSTT